MKSGLHKGVKNSPSLNATKSNSKTDNFQQNPVSPSLFDNRTPPGERYRVRMSKNRDQHTKRFRQEIRDIYHETDQFAIFQQESALVLPIELTPNRILLGHGTPKSDRMRTTISNTQTPDEINGQTMTYDDDLELKDNGKSREMEIPQEQNHNAEVINQNERENELIQSNEDIVAEEESDNDSAQPNEDIVAEEESDNDSAQQNENIVSEEKNENDSVHGNENIVAEEESGNDLAQQNEDIVIEEEESDNDSVQQNENIVAEEESDTDLAQQNKDIVIEEEESDTDSAQPNEDIVAEEESDNEQSNTKEIISDKRSEHTSLISNEVTQQEKIEQDQQVDKATDKNCDLEVSNDANMHEESDQLLPQESSPKYEKLDRNDPSICHFGEQMLEISVLPYLYSLSQKYGTSIGSLKNIRESEFNEWQSMGFDWIWLCGVWQKGENIIHHDLTDQILLNRYKEVLPDWTKEDVVGYPLCIYDYSVDSRLGTIEDLIWFREQLKTRGIKLMLDFVPNDTAIDAPEMSSHPEFYIKSTIKPNDAKFDSARFMEKNDGVAFGAGKWMPPMRFTAQLNFFRKDVREYQMNRMLHISDFCDGFRVHLAQYLSNSNFADYWGNELFTSNSPNLVDIDYQNPQNEFWLNTITTIRNKHPNFVMMAESYGYENQAWLLNSGFNYVYEKELLDKLVFSDVNGFKHMIFNNKFITSKQMVHFVENHDEVRVLHRFWKNEKMACAGSAALLTLPGIRLFYYQQSLGYMNQVDVNLRRCFNPTQNATIHQFYVRLFKILDTNAIRYGDWYPLVVNDSESIIAWKWVKNEQHILVTVNINKAKSGGWIVIDDVPTNQSQVRFHELVQNTAFIRDSNLVRTKGLNIILDEYQSQIFEY